jgi:17beta-estradiol 17-dehydrogenase / very-long-chain 3-oxoacyl-CoA reductase
VNNVGLSLVHPEFFGEVDETRHRDMIELNCQSMVQMTHLVLPQMIEKSKGIIVNLSSVGSCQPTPMLNVYTATKQFVRYFSTSLQTEYQSKGIIVQCVYPGFVATAMTGIKRPKWWAPDPITYTRSAVSTIGIQQHTYGYIPHAIQGYISKDVMPEWLYLITSFNGMKAAKENFLKRKSKRQ